MMETKKIQDARLIEARSLTLGYGDSPIAWDISFFAEPGEILGIVGESGSGKSTILKALNGGKDFGVQVFSGEVLFKGQDLCRMKPSQLQRIRGGQIGMIFQDPSSSFNPIRTFEKQIRTTFRDHGHKEWETEKKQLLEVFEVMNLNDGEQILKSCPFEMSGGMNQRIAIAAATSLHPDLLLADEPTSALDVTIQRQIIDELLQLRDRYGMAIVLVTHNIGVVREMADRIIILNQGRIIESGRVSEVLENPVQEYTKQLLDAVPVLKIRKNLDS